MRILTHCVAAAFAMLGGFHAAMAQTYPAKPITVIVPFPPGGGTDIIARTVASKLTESPGWTMVVENKPGAGGNIGVDIAAKAPPDGYTMVIGQTSNLAINPSLYSKLPYDPIRDLAPVVLLSSAPVVVATTSKSPFKTIGDMIAAAKKSPASVTYGSPGSGTVAHITAEMFQRAAGIKMTHIPYKGASQAMTDLLGGQIDVFLSSVPTLISHIKSGKIRPLAVTSAKRSGELPNVPSVAESGFKGFEATTWFGFLFPAATPEPIVRRMSEEVNRVLGLPGVRKKLEAEGGEVLGGTPAQFSTYLKTEIARWAPLVKESGSKVD